MAGPGLRYGPGQVPNINITVPRAADVSWLGSCGFTKNRLPIQWEMLQPMLNDTVANAAARSAIGEPGAFHAGYAAFITGVLDAHAARGMKCIIDLHNYCRYRDFAFQADGSVIGLIKPSNPLQYAFTTDGAQIRERICALAPGATLTRANLRDFWTRAALQWKSHPGFGGYGLMNEPYNMPPPGGVVESTGGGEDLTIWPEFAKAAIEAIRAVDALGPIYLGGNAWSGAVSIGTLNPGWPLPYSNLIYEVHLYMDAYHNGQSYDYDAEVAKNFSVPWGWGTPINVNTGADRLKVATDWAQAHGVRLAVTETGMPIDDIRWQQEFQLAMNHARQTNCEVYSWNGGSHWSLRNGGINHVPGWHQNKTLEPSMAGPMKASYGIVQATLFDDGPGWAPSGTSVTITVYARGNLASPVTVNVSTTSGSLSRTSLVIPAGANGEASFTFTSAPNTIATLSYSNSAGLASPPPRRVYSLSDPVAYAATSLSDAAMALIAKYSACKWVMADGYTDYMLGAPAQDGQDVRAISDSGFGSSTGNAMEMLNWTNTNPGMGTMRTPVMRLLNGRKYTDHSYWDTFGFWCRKSFSVPGIQPNPRNRVPYNVASNHFAIAAINLPGTAHNGIVFQASNSENAYCSELNFSNNRPSARWIDANGLTVELISPNTLAANTPAVISFTSVPGAQRLRVNQQQMASAASSFATSAFDHMLLGFGFTNYYPQGGFGGHMYAVITGAGAPSATELAVLERYLGSTAGI